MRMPMMQEPTLRTVLYGSVYEYAVECYLQ